MGLSASAGQVDGSMYNVLPQFAFIYWNIDGRYGVNRGEGTGPALWQRFVAGWPGHPNVTYLRRGFAMASSRSHGGHTTRNNQPTHPKKTHRQRGGCRTLRVEPLESRTLLSATLPGTATPDHTALLAANGVAAMLTAGPTGYTPAQIRAAYGINQITFDNGTVAGNGAGETIAIVDAYDDPNIANDLHQFDLAFNLPDPVFTKVSQTGSTTALPAANAGWATEIALDVEWSHAVAPKANILLVEAKSDSFSDLLTAVSYASHASGVVAVSMSWGGGEFSSESAYNSYFTTPSGHSGVTFVASSGDSGAPTSYPAACPDVLSVGGTTLNLTSSGGYESESGWSGSGGGISAYETQPSYQNGVVTQSTTYRANPDVAYDADPNTGFPVYDSYNNPASAPWGQWGGTSDAAPQWAALIAIADQGRALAGEAPLNGATQTLPMLYGLSSSDFHDITSGTSTGHPRYSATAGYDLVTGRGTPEANLIVAGLVGSSTSSPAATHFTVTATPTTDTAGSAFSITVTALNSSNTVYTGYTGTVAFTSSDSAAVADGYLPAAYTFKASDDGVHTFTVTLVTAGSQSVTATDESNSAILGSLSLSVTPAALDHLAFGQQPGSVAPGAAISPAVTVQLFDHYNNLITTDNTDKVSVVLGANPANGTLSGTTTATASGGIATFSNLSINQVGSGYTLVAKVGSMSATSAGFNVATATSTVIEGFEGSSTYYLAGGQSTPDYLSTVAAHDGTYGLVNPSSNTWIYRDDTAVQLKQGDTVSVWVQFSGVANGRAYFGFGASSAGTLSLVAAPNTNQLLIQNNSGYGFTNIGAVSMTWQANQWYRLEVDWGASGAIVGKVFASNGTTLLQTVTASTSVITSGGIAFRATNSGNTYWDTVTRTPGVNNFSQPANVSSAAVADAAGSRTSAAPFVAAAASAGALRQSPAAEQSALEEWFATFGAGSATTTPESHAELSLEAVFAQLGREAAWEL